LHPPPKHGSLLIVSSESSQGQHSDEITKFYSIYIGYREQPEGTGEQSLRFGSSTPIRAVRLTSNFSFRPLPLELRPPRITYENNPDRSPFGSPSTRETVASMPTRQLGPSSRPTHQACPVLSKTALSMAATMRKYPQGGHPSKTARQQTSSTPSTPVRAARPQTQGHNHSENRRRRPRFQQFCNLLPRRSEKNAWRKGR
jgi:hypothetical protein